MCGIVGYIGSRNAQEILIDGLRRLEYRGYDSAGIAIQNGADAIRVHDVAAMAKVARMTDAVMGRINVD